MIDEWDYTKTDKIVCPYCGNIHNDSFDVIVRGFIECEQCKKDFLVEKQITFTSTPANNSINLKDL